MQLTSVDPEQVRVAYEAKRRAELRLGTDDDGDEVLRARLREKERVEVEGDAGRVVARSRTRLDLRAEREQDGDLEISLRARLRTSLRSYGPEDDRSGALQSVARFSESIRVRIEIEAGEESDAARADGLSGLAGRFESALAGESHRFGEAEQADAGDLFEGIRAAFAELLADLRALLLGGPADAPAPIAAPAETEAAEGAAAGTDGEPAASAEPLATPPAEVETAGAASSPEPAPAADATPGDGRVTRFVRLRTDLQGTFSLEMRRLVEELISDRAFDRALEPPAAESEASAGPVLARLRIAYRQRAEIQLFGWTA
jgi:hypothetical protein